MIPLLAGVVSFILAFAAWRWALGSRNWLEGAMVAITFACFGMALAWFVQRHSTRLIHPRKGNPTFSRPAGSDIR